MKITATTLRWYRARITPRWAEKFAHVDRGISIHHVINDQAGIVDRHRDMLNAISLLRLVRKNGEKLQDYMIGKRVERAVTGKRLAIYSRWINRIR